MANRCREENGLWYRGLFSCLWSTEMVDRSPGYCPDSSFPLSCMSHVGSIASFRVCKNSHMILVWITLFSLKGKMNTVIPSFLWRQEGSVLHERRLWMAPARRWPFQRDPPVLISCGLFYCARTNQSHSSCEWRWKGGVGITTVRDHLQLILWNKLKL